MSNLRFERCVDGSRKDEILGFLLENFLENTLQKVLPFKVEQARFHWERSIAGFKNAQLVFSEDVLVAVETGDFVTYRETKEESTELRTANGENSKGTEEFLAEMSNVDLERFGVTDQSKIYSNGVVCVSETMRGKKIGSKLVKNSTEFATQSGADFYFAHCVNNISIKLYKREGFTIANRVSYTDFFKNESEKVAKIDQNHPVACFMIKKL